MSSRALEALDRVLNGSDEPDDVLRSAVSILVGEPEIAFAAIVFVEDGETVVGPRQGHPDESRRVRVPVVYRGAGVGELWVDGEADPAFLERVALLVSAHVLIGWDTEGEAWEP